MALPAEHNGRSSGTTWVNAPKGVVPSPANPWTELPIAAAAEFVLGAPEGSVLALGGIDSEGIRVILDAVEPDGCDRRALFVRVAPAQTTEAIVEKVINLLAETARRRRGWCSKIVCRASMARFLL